MATKLMTFACNTLKEVLNNSKGSCGMSAIIGNDPVEYNNTNTFKIEGRKLDDCIININGAMTTIWLAKYENAFDSETGLDIYNGKYNINDFDCLPNPFTPPQMSIWDLKINGLQNTKIVEYERIEENQEDGKYTVTMRLDNSAYDEPQGLTIDGDYKLSHEVWAVDHTGNVEKTTDNISPTEKEFAIDTLNWPVQKYEWVGKFVYDVSSIELLADVELAVTGTGTGRELVVSIKSCLADKLAIALNENFFTLEAEGLGDETKKQLRKAFIEALEDDSAKEVMYDGVRSALGAEKTLEKLSGKFQKAARNKFDNIFAEVPAGELPKGPEVKNAFDQYLFDRVRYAINCDKSECYLPGILKKASDPQLEPYKSASLLLGDFKLTSAGKVTDITLINVELTGLSDMNIAYKDLIFDEKGINAKYISDVNMKSGLSFRINSQGDPTNGALKVSLKGETLVNIPVTGTEIDNLTLTAEAIELHPHCDDVAVDAEIKSMFAPLIKEVFKNNDVKNKLVGVLNNELKKNRAGVGKHLTDTVRKMLNEKLFS